MEANKYNCHSIKSNIVNKFLFCAVFQVRLRVGFRHELDAILDFRDCTVLVVESW